MEHSLIEIILHLVTFNVEWLIFWDTPGKIVNLFYDSDIVIYPCGSQGWWFGFNLQKYEAIQHIDSLLYNTTLWSLFLFCMQCTDSLNGYFQDIL